VWDGAKPPVITDGITEAEHSSGEQLARPDWSACWFCMQHRPLDNIVRIVTNMFATEHTIQTVGMTRRFC
jgi:hypothetical protein